MAAEAIRTEGLTRRFGAVTALDRVSLRVQVGEAVAVFGPNGAGKTTLLRVIGTLLRPTGGRVWLFGQDLRSGSSALRRRLGVLSHQSFLYPDLTAVENLFFYARMFSLPDAARRVAESVERLELGEWAARPVRTLSRGMLQRCALARALIHRPDLLLLDEPFTALDRDAAAAIERLLREEQERGATVVLATHEVARGFAICQRAIILLRGALQWDGPISPAARAQFDGMYAEAVRSGRTRAMGETCYP